MEALITPQQVIDIAFSPDSFSSSELIRESKIIIAQEHFLRPKLGDSLYDALDGGEYDQFIEDYLQPPLAYYVRYGLLDELSIMVDPNGVIQRVGGETSNSTTKGSQNTKTTSSSESEGVIEQKTTDQKTVSTEGLESTNTTNYERELTEDQTTEESEPSPFALSTTVNSSMETQGGILNDVELETEQKSQTTTENYTQELAVVTQSEETTSTSGTTQDDYTYNDNEQEQTADYTPATLQQVQSLKMRAITDGNTLMRTALRYIRSHIDEFPDYVPSCRYYL